MSTPELDPWIDSAGDGGNRNSMMEFPGNGVQTSFEFNFAGGYIDPANVKAYVYDSASGIQTPVDPVVLTGPNTIQVTPPVATGNFLVVFRDTQKTVPLVDFVNGAVMNEENLDLIAKQAVFNAAEMVDRFDSVNVSSADAIARSVAALTAAESAVSASNAAGAAAGSAVETANAAAAIVAQANEHADEALATANGIDGKAQTALDNSVAAVETANAAESTANAIDGKAQTALDNSAVAVTTANIAKEAADAATDAAGHALQRFEQNEIPTSDIGDIIVQGRGRMRWLTSAYADNNLPPLYRNGGAVTVGTTTVTIAPGSWRGINDDADIKLSSALTKKIQTSGAWASGNSQNGLFSGVATIGTSYHLFIIRRDSDGTIDAGFDTSGVAANRPSGWTSFRRVATVRYTSTNAFLAMTQRGDTFLFTQTVSLLGGSNLSTAFTTLPLNNVLPPSRRCEAKISIALASVATSVVVREPGIVGAETSALTRSAFISGVVAGTTSATGFVMTDANCQIEFAGSAALTGGQFNLSCLGYRDFLED